MGVAVRNREETRKIVKSLVRHGLKTLDLSDNEMAKLHVRYMVGGHAPYELNESVYSLQFPERPGALLRFLLSLGSQWNISLFHYRNHGAAFGKVLMGLQIEAAQQAASSLEGEDEGGALALLARAAQSLQDLASVEPEFQSLAEVLASAQAQAEDAAHSLHAYLRKTDLDPEGLAKLDERLGLWISLARRYKRPPEELPAVLAQWRRELAQLDAASDLQGLEAAEQAAHTAYQQAAKQLSKQRQKAVKPLSEAVTSAMQQLGMEGGRFEVSLQALEEPQAFGLEQVEFLVAGHAGTTPRPLAKVASGGELARIALAISVIASSATATPTLIFDEVDSGIGGGVAEVVGRLLKRLGQDRQVLCVTHLPQVASQAAQHFQVSKGTIADGRTVSRILALPASERVEEIARMLGGLEITATTRKHARELLAS